MKAPNLPTLRLRRPSPQFGHWRGSPPSGLGREDVRAEQLVQRVQHLADAQVLDLPDAGREVAPEVAQHVLPLELAVGDEVELLLQVGREIVLDVALEEGLQEGRDEAALVLGDQALLVDADVVALLQHGERGGIGRGTADAELLHALDQRRLGKARRRLREVLLGLDLAIGDAVALGQRRQAAAVIVLGVIFLALLDHAHAVVAAFLVDLEEALELHDGAGGAQQCRACRRGLSPRCRRWSAPARRTPSGSRPCASRSARRGGPGRDRDGATTSCGRRVTSVGRMASCASCAFLALVLYSRMNGATKRCEYSRAIMPRMALIGLRDDRHAVGSHVGDEADRSRRRCRRPHTGAGRAAWSAWRRSRACGRRPSAASRWRTARTDCASPPSSRRGRPGSRPSRWRP